MSPTFKPRLAQRGSSLIEVLVTLLILMLGLLGLVGLMMQSQRSQMESYQRVQALVVLQDMVNRINTNRKAATCYAIAAADGTGFLGAAGTGYAGTPTCTTGTSEQQARAINDMTEWNSLLLGSAEKSGSSDTGAMLGARGCVTFISTGVYQVSVVWQGSGKTIAPPTGVSCASGLYGDESLRRAVSVPLQIASLS
jgi:type IV pilus assembly protein PilV